MLSTTNFFVPSGLISVKSNINSLGKNLVRVGSSSPSFNIISYHISLFSVVLTPLTVNVITLSSLSLASSLVSGKMLVKSIVSVPSLNVNVTSPADTT